ncbi:hypothetical protein CLU79DRAFT_206320 [Phycomyces nitens]|nr:hypothetical protein CLU79DRAFT_206320 [Phycomyces nitens]
MMSAQAIDIPQSFFFPYFKGLKSCASCSHLWSSFCLFGVLLKDRHSKISLSNTIGDHFVSYIYAKLGTNIPSFILTMVGTSLFLCMENDSIANARTIIDFVVLQLKKKWTLEQDLGPGLAGAVEPWGLVFVSNVEHLECVLRERMVQVPHEDGQPVANEKYLDAIRLCTVKNIHELRAVLSGLHLHATVDSHNKSPNLLEWMESEKDGQPPCVMVVMDLLDLQLSSDLAQSGTKAQGTATVTGEVYLPEPSGQMNADPKRYLQIKLVGLSHTLAALEEARHYLNGYCRQRWETNLGFPDYRETDLLVTSKDCPGLSGDQGELAQEERVGWENIQRVLGYYIQQVV